MLRLYFFVPTLNFSTNTAHSTCLGKAAKKTISFLVDSPLRPLASPPLRLVTGQKNDYKFKKKTFKKVFLSLVGNPAPLPLLSGLTTKKNNFSCGYRQADVGYPAN